MVYVAASLMPETAPKFMGSTHVIKVTVRHHCRYGVFCYGGKNRRKRVQPKARINQKIFIGASYKPNIATEPICNECLSYSKDAMAY